jgi:hypothetical protein
MKSIFKSKTLWYNALTIFVFVATAFLGYTPNDVLTYNLTEIVQNPLFIGLVNTFLRLITTKPVTLFPTPPDTTIDSLPDEPVS